MGQWFRAGAEFRTAVSEGFAAIDYGRFIDANRDELFNRADASELKKFGWSELAATDLENIYTQIGKCSPKDAAKIEAESVQSQSQTQTVF